MKTPALLLSLLVSGALSGCLAGDDEPLASDPALEPAPCQPAWADVFHEVVDLFAPDGGSGEKAFPLAHDASKTRFEAWMEGSGRAERVAVEVLDANGTRLFDHAFSPGLQVSVLSGGGRGFLESVEGAAAKAGDVILRWDADGPVEKVHVTMEAEVCT